MASPSARYFDRLRDAHVLIIGGSSGIGFDMASATVAQNAHVIIASSSQTKIDTAVQRLQKTYPDRTSYICGYACNLADPVALEVHLRTLLDAVVKGTSGAKLDHIVFTAGDVIRVASVQETTIENILAAGTVRFLGPLLLAKLAPAYMNPGPASSITLTAGTMSRRPTKGWTVQAAWSSGVEGITRDLAVDLASIRVNAVNPGAVFTELLHNLPQTVLDNYEDMALLGKMATPEEIAESYVYCMRSTFVVGTIVNADGGRALK